MCPHGAQCPRNDIGRSQNILGPKGNPVLTTDMLATSHVKFRTTYHEIHKKEVFFIIDRLALDFLPVEIAYSLLLKAPEYTCLGTRKLVRD